MSYLPSVESYIIPILRACLILDSSLWRLQFFHEIALLPSLAFWHPIIYNLKVPKYLHFNGSLLTISSKIACNNALSPQCLQLLHMLLKAWLGLAWPDRFRFGTKIAMSLSFLSRFTTCTWIHCILMMCVQSATQVSNWRGMDTGKVSK